MQKEEIKIIHALIIRYLAKFWLIVALSSGLCEYDINRVQLSINFTICLVYSRDI